MQGLPPAEGALWFGHPLSLMKSERALILLTFLGMVGIYIGAWYAYQQYQAYQAKLQQQGVGGFLINQLFGKS